MRFTKIECTREVLLCFVFARGEIRNDSLRKQKKVNKKIMGGNEC